MRTYKKIVRNIEDKVYCDVCGVSCSDPNFGSEYAVLEASWGYSSKSDGRKFDIQICEDCFYETIKFLDNKRSIAGNPTDEDTDPLKGKG